MITVHKKIILCENRYQSNLIVAGQTAPKRMIPLPRRKGVCGEIGENILASGISHQND